MPRQPKPVSRRDALLVAARQQFFTRGYDNTRMEDVAKRAGFSKRTVYLEFPSKGALFATLAEEGIAILRDLLVPIHGKRLPILDEIGAVADAYLKFYREHRGHYRLVFLLTSDAVLADVPAAQRKRLREIEATCVGVLAHSIDRAKAEGVVRNDIDAWTYAVAVWGALNGILLIQEHSLRVDLAGVGVEVLYRSAVDAFLKGAS